MRLPFVSLGLVLAVAGCGESPGLRFTTGDAATGDNDAAVMDGAVVEPDVAATPLDVGTIPIRDNGAVATEALVYAHSDTTLYTVNPRDNRFARVADFTFPRGTTVADMTDIAVDSEGAITGTAGDAVWRIDARTAACTRVVTLPERRFFVGLSWVPRGTVDANNEVLVGATTDGALWRIDVGSGRATQLFTLPRASGQAWTISGDLVSIDGDATYITLRREGAASTANDALGVVDFRNRTLRIVGTDVGFARVFGVGYWRQTLYGFTRTGEFITINTRTGVGRRVSTPTMQFSGAGVTTIASIEAPP
jgi:hypothetical protein